MQELIQHQVLSSTSANITFSSIPSTWTDLVIKLSLRSDGSAIYSFDDLGLRINGDSGNNYIARVLRTREGSISSFGGSASNHILIFGATASGATSSTFSSGDIHIPNYTASTAKTISHEGYTENNSSAMVQGGLVAGLWSGTTAVNSITIFSVNGWNFIPGSSATLYGISRTQAIGKPKATGGNITYANGYWVHTFTGSGTFEAQQDLDVEALVVAGGGGGGGAVGNGGGGGAGGVLITTGSITRGSRLPVIVGGGGVGMRPLQLATVSNGFNSQFLSATAIGGGGGGGYNNAFANAPRGADGGSGGGAWSWASQGGVRGLGTAGQGNNGGLPTVRPGDYAEVTGGGGGAGAPGGDGSSTTTGNGGDGIFWNGSFYGGGGGGGGNLEGSAGGTFGLGGRGGGGRGGDRTSQPDGSPGTANTGGGGGGNSVTSRTVYPQTPGNGGSGVVIVRYRA